MPDYRPGRDPNQVDPPNPFDPEKLKQLFGNSLMWVGAAFLVLIAFLVATIRIGRVTGEQVGILLNRINGDITVIEKSGVRIYNGLLGDFYILDKTVQSFEMAGSNRLKVKTKDGSDVFVTLRVQYKMVPHHADTVIRISGPGDAFKEKWAWDYVRSIGRNYLGELTTEEFYDSSKRTAKIILARQEVNKRLAEYGLKVDNIVIPQRPEFYREYEEMIKKKKLADQAVLEEKSKALAAEQRMYKLIVEATNEKNVTVKKFEGQMERKKIDARAEAERTIKEADAYFDRVTIGAEATFYENQKEAEGILARKKAEAQGIEALKKALEGEGGRNMVKLEYAKKLKQVHISGEPFTIEARTDRFQHTEGAASTRRPAQ